MRISPLSAELSNQIAAGEVIERPASVLKELMENSIDAGATTISVVVEKSGIQLIRISDDGSGIHNADLKLAIKNHTTSKIHRFEDLSSLDSYGFRGEALSSIASVSDCTISSKYTGADTAFSLSRDGDDYTIIPTAHNQGTTIEVKNLFHYVPARRRFLKSPSAEQFHLDLLMKKFALANFHLQIKYTVDGKQQLFLHRATTQAQKDKRVAQILGKKFYQHAAYFSVESHDMTFEGWLATPDYHRSQSDAQYFYLNGRIIKDKLINHAIRTAYEDALPEGRFPVYALYLFIPPQAVDVNVHPAKTEVRLHEARLVHDFLVSAIKRVLADAATPTSTQSRLEIPSIGQKPNNMQTHHYTPTYERTSSTYQPSVSSPPPTTHSSSLHSESICGDYFILFESGQIKLHHIKRYLRALACDALIKQQCYDRLCKPLLLPQSIQMETEALQALETDRGLLSTLGIEYQIVFEDRVVVKKLPLYFSCLDLQALLEGLVKLYQQSDSPLSQKAVLNFLSPLFDNANGQWQIDDLKLVLHTYSVPQEGTDHYGDGLSKILTPGALDRLFQSSA